MKAVNIDDIERAVREVEEVLVKLPVIVGLTVLEVVKAEIMVGLMRILEREEEHEQED